MKHRLKKWIGIAAVLSLLVSAPGIAGAASYIVQPGDSLWKISMQHNISIDQLKRNNGLTSDQLLVGQKLQVPAPGHLLTSHVKPGDTMWKIASRHGVPLAKLINANPQIPDPNHIRPGMESYIPKKPDAYLNGVFPLAAGTYDEYTNTYADSRSWSPTGQQARSHEGVDIFAKEGTPVYSAIGGTVVKAAWNEYGGWRVTIRVDDSTEFYYAHLSKYAPGMKEGIKVKAGQLIGYVGSTGYGPQGTSGKFLPHLHFGIYKRMPTYHSIDPYLYLRWWEFR